MTPAHIGLLIAGGCIAALAIMWFLTFTAPHGWQDSDGFHLGEPDEHADPDNWGA